MHGTGTNVVQKGYYNYFDMDVIIMAQIVFSCRWNVDNKLAILGSPLLYYYWWCVPILQVPQEMKYYTS